MEATLLIEYIYKNFLAEPWKKHNISFWKRWVTLHKREMSGMKDRGGGDHYVLEIVQSILIRVIGACWGIMQNNASEKTSTYNFKATD